MIISIITLGISTVYAEGNTKYKRVGDISPVLTFTFRDGIETLEVPFFNLVSAFEESGENVVAVFEGTEEEANEFYTKYDKVCSGILKYTLYQWDAMPLLTFLSDNS